MGDGDVSTGFQGWASRGLSVYSRRLGDPSQACVLLRGEGDLVWSRQRKKATDTARTSGCEKGDKYLTDRYGERGGDTAGEKR